MQALCRLLMLLFRGGSCGNGIGRRRPIDRPFPFFGE